MIANAAILYEGAIYTGRRHHLIIQHIIKLTGVKRVGSKHPQGFVNEKYEFLTREEAMVDAINCGQITKGKFSKTTLFSEDLW